LIGGLLSSHAQGRQEPGRAIGTVRTQGDLIVMTLNEGALGKANMFDLVRRTLRFTPDGAGYRAENVALKWDAEFGVPVTGWSYLELYLMGLAAPSEVPDFFLLRNLVPAGRDANGRPIFKADRTKITVQDVIAAEGPRLPDVDRAQKKFNTGMVVIVEHGATPSRELIERTNGIKEEWIKYWTTTTGGRSTMTTNPK
jgi:hypothetical protein